MDDFEKKALEGEEAGGPEGTSPSGDAAIRLSSAPEPTAEERQDAGIAPDPDPIPAPADDGDAIGGDVAAEHENANPEGADAADPRADGADAADAAPRSERTFTQSQVNDLVGRTRMETREQTYRAVYGRYGVEDEAGMDELVGNAQRYETVRGEFDDARRGWEAASSQRDAELAEIREHVALLESGIDRSRFDDARAIIRAKGVPVTAESITAEMATHPEWRGGSGAGSENPAFARAPGADAAPAAQMAGSGSTIRVLGNEGGAESDGMSEEEYAMKRLFKL